MVRSAQVFKKQGEDTPEMLPPSLDTHTPEQKALDTMQAKMTALLNNTDVLPDEKMTRHQRIMEQFSHLKSDSLPTKYVLALTITNNMTDIRPAGIEEPEPPTQN